MFTVGTKVRVSSSEVDLFEYTGVIIEIVTNIPWPYKVRLDPVDAISRSYNESLGGVLLAEDEIEVNHNE